MILVFKLNKVTKTKIEVVDALDLIPYHLTGKSLLASQGYDGTGIKVAVIDTGVNWNHSAIGDSVVEQDHNLCGYAGGSMDDDGHGTHVSSTILEIAPSVEIVPYKTIAPYGGDNEWTVKAVEELAERDDIDVVNMSISSNMKRGSADEIRFHEAIQKLSDKNVFICVASGNTGKETELFPACFDEVTTVGAIDINRHEALFSTESEYVDVCQCGVDVLGADYIGGYIKYSGTSMATPMVSGMVALLVQKYKEQHNSERPSGSLMNKMLKLFAVDLGVKGLDSKTGAGYITFKPSASVIKMTIGEKLYTVNGEELEMDVAPQLTNNRTMLPIRYASYGKEVIWQQSNPLDVTIV